MKTELEPQDIDAIAQRVVELLKPMLSGNGKPVDPGIIFDVKGLAEYLKVSKKWVYEKVQFKKIPHVKFSDNGNNNKKGALRFKKKLIDNWLTEHDIPVLVNSKR